MPTTPPTITAAPAAPHRGVKATFSSRLDAFVTWLVAAVSQFGAVATNVFNNATEAFDSATNSAASASNAKTSAANALASENAAAVTAGATAWVSGQSVTQYAAKISPLDGRTYRRKTATGAGTTDPSLDSANYVLLSAAGAAPTLHVRDEKASGAGGGGSAISGVWTVRTLNTSKVNSISGASLASNRITLPAGTYEFEGSAPAFSCDQHQTRLYNVTDAVVIDVGTSEYAYRVGSIYNRSFVRGSFTLSAIKSIELQHRLGNAPDSNHLGIAANSGSTEVYAEIILRKTA